MNNYTLSCVVLCLWWPNDVTFHSCWVGPMVFWNNKNLASIKLVDQPILMKISTYQIDTLNCYEQWNLSISTLHHIWRSNFIVRKYWLKAVLVEWPIYTSILNISKHTWQFNLKCIENIEGKLLLRRAKMVPAKWLWLVMVQIFWLAWNQKWVEKNLHR